MNKALILPDEQVVIKVSICQKCNGIVRAAVEHMMTTKGKNEFKKEVMDYNLAVKSMPLLEYKKGEWTWCNCKD